MICILAMGEVETGYAPSEGTPLYKHANRHLTTSSQGEELHQSISTLSTVLSLMGEDASDIDGRAEQPYSGQASLLETRSTGDVAIRSRAVGPQSRTW